MMNNNKALLLISASGLLLMPCGISLAAYSPQSSLPDAITSVYTHFTHTSHPEEVLLSSSEDLAGFTPPKNLGGDREGFKPTLSLPKSLGRVEMPMMTGMVLPAGRVTVMIMIWIMKNAVARKDIPKPPVPKVRNLPTPAPTTALISKNASLPVRVITLLARSRITVWVRRVTANMLPVNARPAAQGMITPPFPMVMFRTERLVWIATVRPSIKSNPIRATALWTAAPWAEKPGLKPACREQPPCMTIVRLVPTWVNTQPVRAAPYASMKNARVCGMPPAVQRIVRIIVTSAEGKGLLLIPSPLRGEG